MGGLGVTSVLSVFHVFLSFFNIKRGVTKNFEIRSLKECGKLIWN